jgi:hypothetical protein
LVVNGEVSDEGETNEVLALCESVLVRDESCDVLGRIIFTIKRRINNTFVFSILF